MIKAFPLKLFVDPGKPDAILLGKEEFFWDEHDFFIGIKVLLSSDPSMVGGVIKYFCFVDGSSILVEPFEELLVSERKRNQ